MRWQHRHSERGSATVEWVIGITVVILLTLLVIQTAVYFRARQEAVAAARAGVDSGRVLGATPEHATAAARQFLADAGGLHDPTVTSTRTDTVTVTVTGKPSTIIPGVTLNISVTKAAPVEELLP